ncbi:MAG TPA: hypothetical protein VF855_14295 [Acidimicrobiales bacterium]
MRLVAALLVALSVLAGCAGDDDSEVLPRLQVGQIAPAVRAVEAKTGGAQRYSEINATPEGVNLFVTAGEDDEQAWFYADGRLSGPGEPKKREGDSFDLGGVTIDAAPRLVDQVEKQFPGARVVRVALLVVDDQGLVWAVRSRSAKGGELALFYTPGGALLSVSPIG